MFFGYQNRVTQCSWKLVFLYLIGKTDYWYLLYDDYYRCKGMILLETYSALEEGQLMKTLPSFLNIQKEVTGNPDYSMYNLSLREDWKNSKKFCRAVVGE